MQSSSTTGEQSHSFPRRFFMSKSKRLKTLSPSSSSSSSSGNNNNNNNNNNVENCKPANGRLLSECVAVDRTNSSAEYDANTQVKELIHDSECQEDVTTADQKSHGELKKTADSFEPPSASLKLYHGSLSTIRHIDDDDDEDDDNNDNTKDEPAREGQDQSSGQVRGDLQQYHQQQQDSEGSSTLAAPVNHASNKEDLKPERSGIIEEEEANNHIETLSFHPDGQVESQTSAAQQHQQQSSRKIRDSRLFKATKAILLFRRATSSLGNANGGHPPSSSSSHSSNLRSYGSSSNKVGGGGGGFSGQTRSFVRSFWRQNTADNSTCTRSSRVDSFAAGNNNNNNNNNNAANHCRQSRSSFAFLNGRLNSGSGGNATKDSSQVAARAEQNLTASAVAAAASSSSSAFSLPRFIVPRMNALRLPIVCLIKSLDGEIMREIFVHRYELGQYIIDNLKVSLDMQDAKYFGLKLANSLDEQEDVRQPWLDLNESVYKQISKHSKVVTIRNQEDQHQQQAATSNQQQQQQQQSTTKSVDFYLRIKFYPPNLARIQDQFLKQYLWVQLRRDLRLGKLTSSMNSLTYLMACVLQYELGDYKQELVGEKVAQLNVLPNQDLIEQQAIEIWQTRLSGSKRHLVLMQFLRASVILETYGFDYYPVRDHQRQRPYLLGFNYAGIKTIRNGRIINHFRWNSLSKITHERRMIIFHIYPNENSKRKQILGFKCLSNEDCQNLYMRLLEQKYFFTVDLTYFDKSLRRPSHLTESALDQHEQQQLDEWSAPSSGERQVRTQQNVNSTNRCSYEDDADHHHHHHHHHRKDTVCSEDADDDAEPNDDDVEGDEDEDELRHDDKTITTSADPRREQRNLRRSRRARDNQRAPHVSRQNTSSRDEDEFCEPQVHPTTSGPPLEAASFTCVCLECKRREPHPLSAQRLPETTSASCLGQQHAPPTMGPRCAPNIIKSSSLQEPSSYEPLDFRQLEHARCFSHSNSPDNRCLGGVGGAFGHDRSVSSNIPGASLTQQPSHHHHQSHLLQRQCSISKYTPVDMNQSISTSPTPLDGHVTSTAFQNQHHHHMPGLEEHQRPVPPPPASGQYLDQQTTAQRLVNWTEQILVQPTATLLASSSQWSPSQPPPPPSASASRDMPGGRMQPQSCVNSELFMQGIRFCLLILLMNFLLKLSDGISGLLIDLLTFGQQTSSSSSAQQSHQEQVQSMLDRAGSGGES